MNKYPTGSRWKLSGLTLLTCALSASGGFAQSDNDESEEIFELSPFEVSGENETGYQATSTLAGSRIRTDVRDIASPLTVVTGQFLKDTASNNSQDLLTYTTNTEVGGLNGNWGGFGNDQGISDRSSLLRPDNTTRVRGLDQADNTRNFFLTNIPWDSYNTDRVEIQRGPNSILFGVGSPAGIINATTIVSTLDGDHGKVEHQISKFGSNRLVADYNKVLIEDTLAVRIAGLWSDRKFRQEPAFNEDERLFGTATFQTQLFPDSWAEKLNLRLSGETAKVEANNPRILPPEDGITLWFEDAAGDGVDNPIGLGQEVIDMFLYNQGGGGDPFRGPLSNSTILNPFYQPGTTQIDGGDLNNGGIGFWYINGESQPFFVSRQSPRAHPGAFGVNEDGDVVVDNAIDIPYGSPMRVSGFNQYARQVDRMDETEGNPSRFPLASRGYYKDRSLTDPSIFDFYGQLIDGDNKREFRNWDTTNFTLAQTFFESRLGFEFVYDKQNYADWRGGSAWDRPYISIDINKNLQNQLTQYDRVVDPNDSESMLVDPSSYRAIGFTPTASQPYANPMAGAAFTAGSFSSNTLTEIDRESYRYTVFADLDAKDYFDQDSVLAKIIGRHTFTGLLTRDEKLETQTTWRPSATTFDWAYTQSVSGENTKLGESPRGVTPIVYLSGPLFDRSSASGLNLPPIDTYYNPSGTYLTDTFVTEWIHPLDPNDPNYVDPGAAWTNLTGDVAGIQADNPFNYVGRTNLPANILNADTGDRSELITNYGVREEVIDSEGIVWQGHLFDGLVVPTFGWRRDVLKTYTATGAESATGVVSTEATPTDLALYNEGQTRSWGVVAHTPSDWLENVPGVSGLSFYYNEGNNQKVEARYNFDGEPLDNPTANSNDAGIVLDLLDRKLTMKFGKYKTKVKNGNLPGGASLIGANQYYLYQLEAWGTANSLMYLFGREGLDPNQSWHWNWAQIDSGDEGAIEDPTTDTFLNHPSTVAQTAAIDDWITGMDQQFFENYAIPADVAAIQSAYSSYKSSGDIQPLVDAAAASGFAVGTYTTGFSSQNNGQINGISPNGTIDSTSEGYELEINYRPTDNWNIQLNASKTDAYRESLGQPMLDYIASQWSRMQGPAGDIRLWWGGDVTLRRYYQDNIISAVEFQQESVGFQAPELRPYKASLISNYSISDGALKGTNFGGSIRYQDAQILGYGLKDDNSGLSVEKPIFGDSETRIDLWAGHERDLNDRVTWRIQLNLRNVGEDVGLTPISANPDGTVAVQRITEGMNWSITNSFKF